jgi:transposase
VVKASKKLGIKISTAKLILKKFKETGGIFQKKMPDYKRKDLKEGQSEKPGEFASLEMNRN